MPEYSNHQGNLRTNTGLFPVTETPRDRAGSLEIVVLFTGTEVTARVLERTAALSAGLNVTLKLIAVYTAPYPTDLRCPAAVEKHLTARLTELAERACLPASVQLLVARDQEAALRESLRPASAVLLGSRRRLWRTREEKLAHALARQGHHVSLLHFD